MFYLEHTSLQYKLSYSVSGNRASGPETFHCKPSRHMWATQMKLLFFLGEFVSGQEKILERAKNHAFF